MSVAMVAALFKSFLMVPSVVSIILSYIVFKTLGKIFEMLLRTASLIPPSMLCTLRNVFYVEEVVSDHLHPKKRYIPSQKP